MDLQNLKLEYKGETDRDQVLWRLVEDIKEDMATYYAARSEARSIRSRRYPYSEESTTLFEALCCGYLGVAKCLLERDDEVNERDGDGNISLLRASLDGQLEVVKVLLRAKEMVNKSNEAGVTPLHLASSNGHVELVQTLLEANADVNKADNDGKIPLYWALSHNHTEVVALLRAAGATE